MSFENGGAGEFVAEEVPGGADSVRGFGNTELVYPYARIAVGGRLVEMKFIPLVIIGGFALRTMVAMRAEKIREKDSRL